MSALANGRLDIGDLEPGSSYAVALAAGYRDRTPGTRQPATSYLGPTAFLH
jgi:hypothetical protein